MKTSLQKWGNSRGIRLPKRLIEQLGIDIGSEVELDLAPDSKSITIRPTKDSRPIRGRYRIEDLISMMPPDAKPQEIDWGKPEGQEVFLDRKPLLFAFEGPGS